MAAYRRLYGCGKPLRKVVHALLRSLEPRIHGLGVGRTWTPLSTGRFLSYACAAPPRATASGALVVGGRFPALALRISRDNGMTWDTYQIDTEIWAMGGMWEVAPDEVLWVYGSGSSQLRAQRFRVTPTTVHPSPV